MKLGKRSRWIIIFAILLTSLAVFFTHVDDVQATFSNMRAFTVLLRVEREIMQKTPAGQYYDSLFWKHNDELMRISLDHHENNEEFWRVNRLFIPELEALLDGKGDTVRIDSEQVSSLQAELDWLASVGSPSLQEDIQKEEQRFPLDVFIGMTMQEALDYINSSWPSDAIVEKSLVPDSDGKWAYYIYRGVYLEYPADLHPKQTLYFPMEIRFKSSANILDWEQPDHIQVHIWNVTASEKDVEDPHFMNFEGDAKNIMRKSDIQTAQFKGVEYAVGSSNGLISCFYAFQYNYEHQLAVDILVFVDENLQTPDGSNYSAMVNEKYEYFHHMVDSVHIQEP